MLSRLIWLVFLVQGHGIVATVIRNIRDVEFSKTGEFPFMVSLRNTKHKCAGTIINKNWILTAAHCIYDENRFSISIHYGTMLRDSDDEKIAYVSEIVIHPDYDADTLANDIALVKLRRSLIFDDLTQLIELVSETYVTADGTDALQVGWFSTVTKEKSKKRLQKIDLTTISDKECSDFYRTDIETKLICAKTLMTNGTYCYGSGGPLIVDGYQVGVFSFTLGSCDLADPNGFTELPYYVKWISENI